MKVHTKEHRNKTFIPDDVGKNWNRNSKSITLNIFVYHKNSSSVNKKQ